jgi:universal stress protein A
MGVRERILCPIDFSEGSRAALCKALALQKQLGAELDVLHAYAHGRVYLDRTSSTVCSARAPTWGAREQHAAARVRAFLDSLELRASSSFELVLIDGEPIQAILEHAQRHPYDLIVIGAPGGGAASQMYRGSVTETIVTLAECPVLVVHGTGSRRSRSAVSTSMLPRSECPTVRPPSRKSESL